MNMTENTTHRSPTLLLDLPSEILDLIFSYAVPSGRTFRIPCERSLQPSDDPSSETRYPFVPGTPLVPDDRGSDVKLNICGLLLIHRHLYPDILSRLYATNTFYFPSPACRDRFIRQVSPSALLHVQSIYVDIRGPPIERGLGHRYIWSGSADKWVAGIPPHLPVMFPALRELKLGGIGSGTTRAHPITISGTYGKREHTEHHLWRLDNISLVARIIGLNTNGSDDSENKTPRRAAASDTSRHHHNPFEGGHVICADAGHCYEERTIPGWGELHGTRIVTKDTKVVLGSRERQVLDIAGAVAQAQQFERDRIEMGIPAALSTAMSRQPASSSLRKYQVSDILYN